MRHNFDTTLWTLQPLITKFVHFVSMAPISQFCSKRRIILSIAFVMVVAFWFISYKDNDNVSFVWYIQQWLQSNESINSTNITTFAFVNDFGDTTNTPPLVLIWTHKNYKLTRDWISPLFDGCPDNSNCTLITDRSRLNESAAIVFHIGYMDWKDLPPVRYPHQYYVVGFFESPANTNEDFSPPNRRNFFNLTMTYRTDSDVYWAWCGFLRPSLRLMSDVDFEKIRETVEGKSKLVAWFVSQCGTPSGRDRLVKKLQEYMPVDVYGRCGPLKCSRTGWNDGMRESGLQDAGPCSQLLTKEYKFYLSLENSICKGYVTEKLYFNMDNSLVIPVVFERKLVLDSIVDKEMARRMNGSFIAVDDFKTVHDLAEYLKYLDGNMTAYMEYFQWRKNSEIGFVKRCQLCKILKEGKRRTIDDISEWWFGQGQCHSWNGS